MFKIDCLGMNKEEIIEAIIGVTVVACTIFIVSVAKDHGAFSWIKDLMSLL
jgi:hypothetical protein